MIGESYDRLAVLRVFNRSQSQDSSGNPTLENIDPTGTEFRSRMADGSPGFRISFHVEKTAGITPVPNPSRIQIYNLGPTSRALVSKYNNLVILQAGYGNQAETLFKGNISHAKTVKEGADYITTIEAADGIFAFQNSLVNQSFSQGTTVTQVVKTLVDSLKGAGINSGAIQGLPATSYNNGIVLSGKATDQLKEICDKNNLNFSIQDGNVVILPYGADRGTPTIVLSPNTGLVGIPELREVSAGTTTTQLEQGTGRGALVSFKCLLNAKIGAQQKIQIISKFVNGNYTTIKTTHTGDSFEGSWLTEAEAT